VQHHYFYRYAYFSHYFYGYSYYGAAFLGLPALGGGLPGGYGLWRHSGGKWVLEKNACAPGFESRPPIEKGTFEGEIRRTPGVPNDRS
jgi:hypothetical protein